MRLWVIFNGPGFINAMQNKKYKRGLIVGKFYPFHKGHRYLIEFALKRVNCLTVIVCQTERYKIPAHIRANWIKEIFPQIEVKILEHDPSLDSTSTRISKKWAELTINFLGYNPNVVFSSEKYGEAYAKYMGSQHIMVDNKRKTVSVSATKIRKNLSKYWDFLENPAKAYFAKRIVILGAESTGTTTLAQNLAKHYKTTWVPEYGRIYYEGKMYSQNPTTWKTTEFLHIANIQNKMEEILAEQCSQLLICDTDSLATTIWHQRYIGHKAKELDKLVNTDHYSLYILTGTDIPFKQDGTRDGEHLREWMHQLFVNELRKRKLKFIIVKGNKKERLSQAIKEIDKISINKSF